MAQKFNVGDIVQCIDRYEAPYLKFHKKYKVYDIVDMSDGLQLLKIIEGDNKLTPDWYGAKRFALVEAIQKLYFCNDNRTLMTEDEAMEYLRKNGGGTMYKKVLTMSIETKTEEKIERF